MYKLTNLLKRCGSCGNANHRARLLHVEIRLYMSHFSRISWSLCNSRVRTMPAKNRGNSQLKRIYYRKQFTENTNSLMIVTHRVNFPWFSTLTHAYNRVTKMGIQVFYARQVVPSRPADQHGVCQCQFYAAFAVESDQPRDWNSYEGIGGDWYRPVR